MIQVFVSYSHLDRAYLEKGELIDYLKNKLKGKVKFWYDTDIATGDAWNEKIHNNILNSQIAILLISKNFIGSKYINRVEIRKFFTATIKKFVVFPIIMSPCKTQKIKWLKPTQYIPSGNESVEKNYGDKKRRDTLYKKILDDLQEQVAYLKKPEISAGQALSSLINLINTIESELLNVCKREDLANKDHSLMFEGRSKELYARKKSTGTGGGYLQVVKFEELKNSLKPADFKRIRLIDKRLSGRYSKWFALEAQAIRPQTQAKRKQLSALKYGLIRAMFADLMEMLRYLQLIGFDLHDHYSQIYQSMGALHKTRAMDTL